MSRPNTIRAAAAQIFGSPIDKASDALDNVNRLVAQAAEQSVDLLVLPECAYPAYYLGATDAYPNANDLSPDAFVDHLRRQAKKHEIHLVCGFVDQRDGKLFNSAVVIDPQGQELGRSDKTFLWGDDNTWFTPGDRIKPIESSLGTIGIVICADGRAPEVAMGLVAQGAQLLVVPTCWVNVAKETGRFANAQAEFMIHARAIECQVPIIAANKFGRETPDLAYCGWSAIYDAQGKQLARAAPDREELIAAEIEVAAPQSFEIPRWAIRRICGDDPPVPPEENIDLGAVGIALAPGCMVAELVAGQRDGLRELADRNIEILGSHATDEETAARFELYGRTVGISVVNFPYVERLMIERFGSFGCVSSEHMLSFVPARVMALDGASIVFVVGDDVDVAILRTRAAENRVFLAAAFERSAALIDPGGQIIARCDPDQPRVLEARIDLNQSAAKEVFARTHIWEQRRPTLYAKAFGVGNLLHGADQL